MENVRQTLDAYWRQRLEEARNRYQAARVAVSIAGGIHSDAPSPDGSFAFGRALRVEREALTEYTHILRIFNAVVIRGKTPAEE